MAWAVRLLRQCATLVALTGEAWVLREVFPLAATRCCALPCTSQKPLQGVWGARGLRAPGLRAQAGSGRGPGPLRWAWAEGGGAVARLELTKKGLCDLESKCARELARRDSCCTSPPRP